jgi:hypothetical protein
VLDLLGGHVLRRLLLRKRIPSGCCEFVDEDVENVCACVGGWYWWKDWVNISSSGKVFKPFFRALAREFLAMVGDF